MKNEGFIIKGDERYLFHSPFAIRHSAFFVWADMVKFSHCIFALPFALIATFLAGRQIAGRGRPYFWQLFLIVVCMVAARSVAMTFNRIADAAIDARNPRTAHRALPSGRLSKRSAGVILAVSAAVFLCGCLGFWAAPYSNPWPILLSGPILVVLCAYSFCKRFTSWSHLFLGAAIGLSPLAAWIAIDPASVGLSVVILMFAVTSWIGGFDIIYACQDIEADQKDGLYSLPARIGPKKALRLARLLHVITVLCLVGLWRIAGLGWMYLAGVACVAVLLTIENSLVHPNDYGKVNLAFFTVNGIVSCILATAAIVDVLV